MTMTDKRVASGRGVSGAGDIKKGGILKRLGSSRTDRFTYTAQSQNKQHLSHESEKKTLYLHWSGERQSHGHVVSTRGCCHRVYIPGYEHVSQLFFFGRVSAGVAGSGGSNSVSDIYIYIFPGERGAVVTR